MITSDPTPVPTRSERPLAVVTGASRGIGAAIARRLAADGLAVAVHYRKDAAAAADVVDRIRTAGGAAFAFAADLADPAEVTGFWQSHDEAAGALRKSPVRVLVNNAGITLRGAIEDVEAEDVTHQQQVNTIAPLLLTKSALGRLSDGGRIVNISSGATRIALPEIIAYAMTKGAIDAFTLALAAHLGPRRITVNAVAPGIVDTDMNAAWLRGDASAIAAASAHSTFGRVGTPDDVADVVAFLASDDARWITGQVIDATGGSHL